MIPTKNPTNFSGGSVKFDKLYIITIVFSLLALWGFIYARFFASGWEGLGGVIIMMFFGMGAILSIPTILFERKLVDNRTWWSYFGVIVISLFLSGVSMWLYLGAPM